MRIGRVMDPPFGVTMCDCAAAENIPARFIPYLMARLCES
jgi:hypothetical protein